METGSQVIMDAATHEGQAITGMWYQMYSLDTAPKDAIMQFQQKFGYWPEMYGYNKSALLVGPIRKPDFIAPVVTHDTPSEARNDRNHVTTHPE